MSEKEKNANNQFFACFHLKAFNFLQALKFYYLIILPFPKRQILDTSKLKEFADNIVKFDENGRRFFKLVENTVGKGEIACYKQLFLFPLQTHKKQGLFGKGLIANICLMYRYI